MDRTIVILVAFVILLVFWMILLVSLHRLQQIKQKGTTEKGALDAKPDDIRDPDMPVKTFSETLVNTKSSKDKKTLDSSYATEYNLRQCPYCETFNAQDTLRCCACGKHIRR